MDPVYMTRAQLQATLKARSRTVKPDTHNPRMRISALYCLNEMNRRIRCELQHGARHRAGA